MRISDWSSDVCSSDLPPSFGRKLLCDAHASISVPSTVKCSSDSSSRRRACASTAPRNLAATSPSSTRSRFPPPRLRRPKHMLGEHGHLPHRRTHPHPHDTATAQYVLAVPNTSPLRAEGEDSQKTQPPHAHPGRHRGP